MVHCCSSFGKMWNGFNSSRLFGRTLADSLPADVEIGVINVAVGGCRIELFDKDNYASYVAGSPDWLKIWSLSMMEILMQD